MTPALISEIWISGEAVARVAFKCLGSLPERLLLVLSPFPGCHAAGDHGLPALCYPNVLNDYRTNTCDPRIIPGIAGAFGPRDDAQRVHPHSLGLEEEGSRAGRRGCVLRCSQLRSGSDSARTGKLMEVEVVRGRSGEPGRTRTCNPLLNPEMLCSWFFKHFLASCLTV